MPSKKYSNGGYPKVIKRSEGYPLFNYAGRAEKPPAGQNQFFSFSSACFLCLRFSFSTRADVRVR